MCVRVYNIHMYTHAHTHPTGSVSLENPNTDLPNIKPNICIVLWSFKECFQKLCHLTQLSKFFKLKYKSSNALNSYKAIYRYKVAHTHTKKKKKNQKVELGH